MTNMVGTTLILSDGDARALLALTRERCACAPRSPHRKFSSSQWCEWHGEIMLDGGRAVARLVFARSLGTRLWQEEWTRARRGEDDNMTNP